MAFRTPTREAQNASTGNTNTITATLPSAPVAGERIIIVAAHSDEFINTPSGFVEDGFDAGAGVVCIFSKVATGSEGTNFTVTAAGPGSFAVHVSCWNDLGAFDDKGFGFSRSTGVINSGTLNTDAGNEIFACFSIRKNALPTDGAWADEFNGRLKKVGTSGSTWNQQLLVGNFTTPGGAISDTYTYTESGSTTAYGSLFSYVGVEPSGPDPLATPVVTVQGTTPPSSAGATDGSITVSWPAVPDAETYEVGYASGHNQTGDFTQASANATSPYTITGLAAGDYTVAVRAANGD